MINMVKRLVHINSLWPSHLVNAFLFYIASVYDPYLSVFAFPFLQINCAVIPREGVTIDEAEVLRFGKQNLASFKVPKKVFITDSLPKTATGKIQRRIVAEHFLAQISTAKVPKFGA